ncbi:MAG: hypothetical protein IH623_03915 [Verrucomicrobia bacterium]|nr:hypothetical protein [Verrucomicrobiota bacterium]
MPAKLLSETYSGDPLNDLAVTNAYDAYMRRSAIALKTQTTTLTQFDYDPAGRLQDLTNASCRAAYTYLANAPLVSQIAFTVTHRGAWARPMNCSVAVDKLTMSGMTLSRTGPPVCHCHNDAHEKTRYL